MTRALRRGTPVALAAAALLLVGCTPGPDSEAACMELPSGSLSDGVTVDGDFRVPPTATFDLPLQPDAIERTVVREGDGATEAGARECHGEHVLRLDGHAALLAAAHDHGRPSRSPTPRRPPSSC
ncbi:hypothetical protein [Agromyces bauzanensis]|uniref:Uncharacterized protein n=1 Tax=Agromyces bauzanensis TaxID=1308924 RepID=A0A917PE34_9MICO|nr:hypothetical protein [Agromyces bauzanensis]GGJ72623.1 hypothetical protein GCM10011372_08270 [Agromyces bauzanensis]